MISIEIISNGIISNYPYGEKTYYKDTEHLIKCVIEGEIERMNDLQKHHDSIGQVFAMEFSINEQKLTKQ
ncbi:hypothetical protein [Tenacibaculum sp. nBUS_03]|uniref:hypothetical protein n=1 Tax=Tenacibaculum sp. nBUS_03 TaxID=3395320 RepID=UPI003EB866DA